MKLKKFSFVKIQEQPHKLSYKYKLTNHKLRIPDKKDVQIVKQILNFFVNTKKKLEFFWWGMAVFE